MAKNSTPQKTISIGTGKRLRKLQAVNLAMEQIEKQYGRGSIMRSSIDTYALF